MRAGGVQSGTPGRHVGDHHVENGGIASTMPERVVGQPVQQPGVPSEGKSDDAAACRASDFIAPAASRMARSRCTGSAMRVQVHQAERGSQPRN